MRVLDKETMELAAKVIASPEKIDLNGKEGVTLILGLCKFDNVSEVKGLSRFLDEASPLIDAMFIDAAKNPTVEDGDFTFKSFANLILTLDHFNLLAKSTELSEGALKALASIFKAKIKKDPSMIEQGLILFKTVSSLKVNHQDQFKLCLQAADYLQESVTKIPSIDNAHLLSFYSLVQ